MNREYPVTGIVTMKNGNTWSFHSVKSSDEDLIKHAKKESKRFFSQIVDKVTISTLNEGVRVIYRRLKIKTYVIILSRVFPKTHSKSGQETGFAKALKRKEKIHTIRSNFSLWEKRAKLINAGDAILSVRQWEGLPYRSKQIEIAQFTHIGIQELRSMDSTTGYIIGEKQNVLPIPIEMLVSNDNLYVWDFKEWFAKKPNPNNTFVIIHFTYFKYWDR